MPAFSIIAAIRPDRSPAPNFQRLATALKRLLLAVATLAVEDSLKAQEARPGSVAPRAMQMWAPGLAGYTDDVLFGDVWRRTDLGPRDRSLVTVAALVATGKSAQLPGHLGRALDNGVTPAEISGLVTHLAFYAGWPNAVSALAVIDTVFTERKIAPAAVRVSGAPSPLPASEAARRAAVARTVAPLAPKLAELTDETLFADLWRRPDLTPRDRSLVTIVALAAGGDAGQLAFHIARGEENGLTRTQIAEAMTHLAFYAGWPKAMSGIAALREAEQPIAESAAPAALTLVPPGEAPQPGPSNHFTGRVMVSSGFEGDGGSRLGGATVAFEAGARSNWHSHPLGQLLIVTMGEGRIQADGGPVRVVRAGDTVWTPPGVRHWHGAAPTKAMTHVAVSEQAPGQTVTWMEPVTDAAYAGDRTSSTGS
jgi:4-carboxymuconolactone decarboxylase